MAEAGFYGIAVLGLPLGQGVTGSRAARLDGIVKATDTNAPYTVANEYICGRLASCLGLPVPPGTIAKLDTGELVYTMIRFGVAGDTPPPGDADQLNSHRPELAARIAVFDNWILNPDRHSGNFAWIPQSGTPSAYASIFDHGHALFGTAAANGKAALEGQRDAAMWQGVFPAVVQDPSYLAKAAALVNSCAPELINEACEAPYRLGVINHEEYKTASEILVHRKTLMQHHVATSHSSFPKVTDWGVW